MMVGHLLKYEAVVRHVLIIRKITLDQDWKMPDFSQPYDKLKQKYCFPLF